ncbi:MAG: hypothetical protein IJ481_00085, partial [Alphaproteobacteria bacterium]|nr:hypothetical protein [Alphaproteobacteria bacterium]
RFVQQQAKEHNLDTILFVARDGYLLHKVFQDIEPNIKSHYVYAPRRLMSTAFLKYNPNSSKTSSKIIGYCATQDQRIKEAYKQLGENNAYNNHNFIQQHIDIIKPIIQKNHDNYKRYIDSIVTTDKKIGVVDGFSRGYTTQRLLSRFLKNDILGIYYLLAVDPVNGIKTVEFNNRDYDIKPKEYIIPKYLCFFEMILSSPEDPIEYVSVEGKPLYEPNPKYDEQLKTKAYKEISPGALNFINDTKQNFKSAYTIFEAETLMAWKKIFISYPRENDKYYMQNLAKYCDNEYVEKSNLHVYEPIFIAYTKLTDITTSPLQTLKRIKSAPWKTRTQKIALALFGWMI